MISHLRQPITPPISSKPGWAPTLLEKKPQCGDWPSGSCTVVPPDAAYGAFPPAPRNRGWHLLSPLWAQRPFHSSLWPCFPPSRGWGEPMGKKNVVTSHIKSLNPSSTSSFVVTVKEGALLLVQERCEIEQNAPRARGHVPLWLSKNFTPLSSHQHVSVWHPLFLPNTLITINLPLHGRWLSLLGPNALVSSTR